MGRGAAGRQEKLRNREEWKKLLRTARNRRIPHMPMERMKYELNKRQWILGPVYDNEKENWRILTNKEIYASVKKPAITETIRLNRLRWFGHVQRMEGNGIPKRVLYMNMGTRLRGGPRNRWQHEVREDGRIDGGEG